MARNDALHRVFLEVEVTVRRLRIVRAEREKVKQEFVDRVGRCNGIEGNDAGVRLVDAICLVFALGVRLRLDGELRRVDQSVAPQAPIARPDLAHRGHGVFDDASGSGAHFGAHLGNGYEVLVGKRVDDEAGPHGVGGEEDEVAVAQPLRNGVGNDVLSESVESGVR